MELSTHASHPFSTTKIKGDVGESIAVKYLENRGFSVIDRNYRKIWGEIDIVCVKDGTIHFIEVKSVTAHFMDGHHPEDNVHGLKRKKIGRMIETYLEEKKSLNTGFLFHVVCVYMDMKARKARVKMLENVIL